MFRCGCAAAILALAMPASAMANATSGYVGLGYASIDDDDDNAKMSFTTFEGAVVTAVSERLTLQFDARNTDMDHQSHNDAFDALNAHLFTRNDEWALGVFAGKNNRAGSSFWTLGAEGQIYTARSTFGGAVAFARESNDWSSEEVRTVEFDGAFFLNPNTALGAGFTWYDDDWESEDGFLYGVSIEHQLAASPISLGAQLSVTDGDYSSGGGHETDMFGVFARWNFGTADLQTRSREGASMPGAASTGRQNVGAW